MGFERISEVQDEITALCAAAHAPVIFATQILENLNKTGLATRAEVTDASFGMKADGILLNKGPHTIQTIRILKEILARKRNLYFKKQPASHPLEMAEEFFHLSSAT
jgi:pyruvate kinase